MLLVLLSCVVVVQKMEHAKVLLVLTGGTAGMKYDSNGSLAPVPGYLNECIQNQLLQRHSSYGTPSVRVLEFPDQLDSADMSSEDWKRIALTIQAHYHSYDGFVVVMGTDTMAYCASALAFMFDNLAKPVVVTGAMLPIERGDSDAPRNLMVAITCAAISNICEVVVVSASSVFRGCRVKKMDSGAIGAFESPNFPVLAKSQGPLLVHRNLVRRPDPRLALEVNTAMETKIIAIRLVPGFTSQLQLLERGSEVMGGLRGLVLELFGAGNAPKSQPLIDSVKRCVQLGVLVVICSQCPKGQVDLLAYANGRQLLEAGAISARDMTFEACVTKLGHLLANPALTADQVKLKMTQNLRGEMNPEVDHEPRYGGFRVEDLEFTPRL